jgi:predicted RNA-binding Zn ribbon-like protein
MTCKGFYKVTHEEVAVPVTLNGMTLPSWASHVEDKLAPMPLLLVQAFVDTLDQDLGTDLFAHPDEARAWLADAGLRVPEPQNPDRADLSFADDLALAREARESIRALIGRNTGNEPLAPGDLAPLETILDRARPRLSVGADGRVRLGPALPARALADGLLGLLLIIRDAQAHGSWDRLKLCGNPDCRWAFYDRSHSRQGAWCDMASCGNRLKNRNLRARRAQAGLARHVCPNGGVTSLPYQSGRSLSGRIVACGRL